MKRTISRIPFTASLLAAATTFMSLAPPADAGVVNISVENNAYNSSFFDRSGVFTYPFLTYDYNYDLNGVPIALSSSYSSPGDPDLSASGSASSLADSLSITLLASSSSSGDARLSDPADYISVVGSSYSVLHFTLTTSSIVTLYAHGEVSSTVTDGPGSSIADAAVYLYSNDGLFTLYYFNGSYTPYGQTGFDDTTSLTLPAGDYEFAALSTSMGNPDTSDASAASQTSLAYGQIYDIVAAPIPEPASFAVWSLMAGLFGFCTRRTKRTQLPLRTRSSGRATQIRCL